MNTVARIPRRRPSEAPQQEVHESTLHVKGSAFGINEEERRVLEVVKLETDPAYARVSVGQTRQIAEYESLRVDVSISVPCYPEEVLEVAERAAGEAAAFLQQELNRWGVKT